MEIILENNQFDSNEFYKLINNITSMSCEQLIETHSRLIGKTDSSGFYKGDLGIYYISRILDHDYGFCIPEATPSELKKFFNSKYVSDYFKQLIKDNLKKLPHFIIETIDSDRTISEFTEDEYYNIYEQAQTEEYKQAITEGISANYIAGLLLVLAFRLDSNGARSFLNNKIDPLHVIKRIVVTSGLNSRSEYYSGRGATICDLNGEHLIAIYNKLAEISEDKALNMAKMTVSMPTLGATEFIESLYNLARNDYRLTECQLQTDNTSLGEARGRQREVIAFASFVSASYRRGDDTSYIKSQFINLLPNDVRAEIIRYECDINKEENREHYGSLPKSRKRKL